MLLNIALHGMENMLNIIYGKHDYLHPKSEYALVRYADDFVVCAKSQESCIKAKKMINDWLSIRGLELSEEKTRILHVKEGFDFLGFNIRQYNTQSRRRGITLLVKPSKSSIKSFKKRIMIEWKRSFSWTIDRVIDNLNLRIMGWCSYFNKVISKRTFTQLDRWMWMRQARFVCRKHHNRCWKWLKVHYWGRIKSRNDNWVFMDKTKNLYLWKMQWTAIKRHILVKGKASPDNPELREYWQKRQANKPKYFFKIRQMLWRRQEGKCPVCADSIDNGEDVQLHHKIPTRCGGSDHIDNLCLLHANCHRQVHSKPGQLIAAVSKLLEPYA